MNSPAAFIRRVSLALVMLSAVSARADLVRLRDKGVIACRIVEQSPAGLRLVTSDNAGRRELTVANAEVVERKHGADEIAAIETSTDAAQLSTWATSYYHAGLEMLAKRCIRGALASDPKIGARPRKSPSGGDNGSGDFVSFWNRTVLRARVDAAASRSSAAAVSLAKWAREAGLKEESAFYLRKAWSIEPGQEKAAELASEWGISLERWIQLDLTTALDQPLVTDFIQDENSQVDAEPGNSFLTIPMRFDRSNRAADGAKAQQSLARNSFKGKDARGFYGMRIIDVDRDRLALNDPAHSVVYERLSLKPAEGPDRPIEVRNQLGPRTVPPPSPDSQRANKLAKQPRLRSRPERARSTGWIGLIVEIPRGGGTLRLEWAGGGEELLDIDFIQQVRTSAVDSIRPPVVSAGGQAQTGGWDKVAAIQRALQYTAGPSPSMAALAIEWLLRLRLDLERRGGPEAEADLDAWGAAVDEVILQAGGRGEEQVRSAAWRYFSTHSSPSYLNPSPHVSESLRTAGLELQNEWNRIIGCGLAPGECGNWWKSPPPLQHPRWTSLPGDPLTAAQICAARLSEAILDSTDAFVCGEALDRLIALPTAATDWRFLESASEVAQRLALNRLGDIPDRTSQKQVIQALVLSASPEIAHELSIAARRIEMNAGETGATLLRQWSTLGSDAQRVAFLRSLAGLSLGNSVYGRRFDEILRESLDVGGEVREAVWQLAISQLNFRRENAAAGRPLITSSNAAATRPYGPFPMIIDSESRDPLIHTSFDALNRGRLELKVSAAIALLDLGYADEVARAMLGAEVPDDIRKSLLEMLLARTDVHASDAFLALSAGLLRPEGAICSPQILDHLRDLLLETSSSQMWRVRAAFKAGADYEAINALGSSLDKTGANSVERLIKLTGHFTRQDVQRFRRATSLKARADAMAQINLRGGQRVDGDYNVIAVVATTERVIPSTEDIASGASHRIRWAHPERITITLPPIRLQSRDMADSYKVFWNDESIGSGRVLEQALPLRSPRAYYPLLRTSTDWWTQTGTSPDEDESAGGEAPEHGPVRLQSRKILRSQTAGTMTLKIGKYLERGIRDAGIFSPEELADLVPPSLSITLRYCTFGSYAGTSVSIQPGMTPAKEGDIPQPKADPGPRHLTNVMLVLERAEAEK